MREESAAAPGRVNLIGEHTDYQEGFVLPAVIPQRTVATVRPIGGRRVRATSADMGIGRGEYELGAEQPGRGWLDYIQGITAILRARGLEIAGFDLEVASRVPIGSGLSSSAALEVSVLRALARAFELPLDDVEIARVAQQAEVEFVGAPVGIMDQMAASLGRPGEALFIDTRTLGVERIAIPAAVELLVIDSGIPHKHAGGEYGTRRRESEEAARGLGVRTLRDVDVEEIARLDALPPLLARRARHVVTENARVRRAVDALRAADTGALGTLFAESHASLRDDYEVSLPDVDTLVEVGRKDPEVFAARMTGGGFGGAVVMLARPGAAREAGRRIVEVHRAATGRPSTVLVPEGKN